MKKRFIINLFFLLGLNLTIKSFWILGVDRGVQNALPSEDYGLYFALLNLSFLFNILLDFGLTNYNNRAIAQNKYLLPKYLSHLVPIKFVMAIVFTIVVMSVALIMGYDVHALKLLAVMCLSQFFASMLTYLRSNISGLLMFKTDSVLSVLDRFLVIIFCSILLWTHWFNVTFKIEYFVYSQLVAYIINCLLALTICLKKSGFIRLKWSKAMAYKIIRDSYPFAVLTLLMAFYNKCDSIMIERLLPNGAEQSGVYASAFRLVDAANMIAYLFSVILLPLFANLISKKEDPKPIIKISTHILLFVSIGFVIICQLYGHNLMSLMYNKHINESFNVFKILSFCFIPISMTYIFGTLLTANGSLKYLNIVATIGMVLNIAINLSLVPRFEALGAAYSSLVAQSITALLQIIIALRVFDIKFKALYALRLALFIVSLIISAIAIKHISLSWGYDVMISLGAMTLLSFVFGIFNFKDILHLFTSYINKKQPTE